MRLNVRNSLRRPAGEHISTPLYAQFAHGDSILFHSPKIQGDRVETVWRSMCHKHEVSLQFLSNLAAYNTDFETWLQNDK